MCQLGLLFNKQQHDSHLQSQSEVHQVIISVIKISLPNSTHSRISSTLRVALVHLKGRGGVRAAVAVELGGGGDEAV